MTIVAKVWIDEDCITCDACQDICPEVFEVNDDTSKILAAVRTDGKFDRNEGGSLMVGSLGADYGEMILEAAEACPVEVIKFELVTDGAAAVEPVAAAEVISYAVLKLNSLKLLPLSIVIKTVPVELKCIPDKTV